MSNHKPSLTPEGEIIVEVALTEDVWGQVLHRIEHGAREWADLRMARSAIDTSIKLARHHATSGLTSGQAQGYIETGLIEPPLEFDALLDTFEDDLDRRREYALDESIAEGLDFDSYPDFGRPNGE